MAERVGFEPTVLLLVQRFSRPPRSTTPAPLRMCGLAFEALFNGLCARLQEGKNKTFGFDAEIVVWERFVADLAGAGWGGLCQLFGITLLLR